jgi:UDP-N-acetylglucosamine 2-epimerase (non-hydrolysing)
MKILSVLGTRPEAIKMAPVIHELRRAGKDLDSRVCVTAQHREMVDKALVLFGIVPDYDLDVMQTAQSSTMVASRILARLEPVFEEYRPDWILVQGDTTTVAAAALAAFYSGIKVGHVEAGLRTYDKRQPFPEEMNRRVTGAVADLHFAPTERARKNLLREGTPAEHIIVTGNPVIDALLWAAEHPPEASDSRLMEFGKKVRTILVTIHRRENWGEPLKQICLALRDLATEHSSSIRIVYPVHPNPNVRDTVYSLLDGVDGITLVEPLDYLTLVHVMKKSFLVVTDSGGIQEEAPSLGVPVLVLREVTERPEAVEAGTVKIVGVHRADIAAAVRQLIESKSHYDAMSCAVNPYGDGKASQRIVAALSGKPFSEFQP